MQTEQTPHQKLVAEYEERRQNPARFPALQHAQPRANRDNAPMHVYVGPPDTPHAFLPSGFNVWFVRPANVPAPDGTRLYASFQPLTSSV